MFSGFSRLKTRIGILLSRQSEAAVESITLRLRLSTSLNVTSENFLASGVTDGTSLFEKCKSLEILRLGFNSKLTKMNNMFNDCPNLIELSLPNLFSLIESDSGVVNNALKDFKRFMKSAFDCLCEIDSSSHGFYIKTQIDSSNSKQKSYTISVSDDEILITAESDRTIAQAIYYLEFLLFEKKAPILKKGEIKVTLPYSPRMVHSAYGYDDFPDEYLQWCAWHRLLRSR